MCPGETATPNEIQFSGIGRIANLPLGYAPGDADRGFGSLAQRLAIG